MTKYFNHKEFTKQLNAWYKDNPKFRTIAKVSDIERMLLRLHTLHHEILYSKAGKSPSRYQLLTTNARDSNDKSKALMFQIDPTKIRKQNATTPTNRYDMIIVGSRGVRVVKDGTLAIDLNSKEFYEDVKSFMRAERTAIKLTEQKKPLSFTKRVFNTVGTAVLLGLGYTLLKKYVVGKETHEIWQKPDCTIALESSSTRLDSRTFVSDNDSVL